MSSIRKVLSSRANGAHSRGPSTPFGKEISSRNNFRHGLLARCLVLHCESDETFGALLQQHIARLQPADDLEFGMIEEMVAAHWRLRRAWAMETRMIENQASAQPPDGHSDPLDCITKAFTDLAASPSLALIHRYETRLHLMYQRAMQNLLLLRIAAESNEPAPPCVPPSVPFEPSPISGQPDNLPASPIQDTEVPED